MFMVFHASTEHKRKLIAGFATLLAIGLVVGWLMG